MLVIGITGTLGSGKGTLVEYLVSKKGFVHFSVRGFISQEIVTRGLPLNRDSMVLVANSLRAAHSPSYIIDQLYEEALKAGKNSIIESIRTPGEVESLRAKGRFVLFAVDADPLLRYSRIIQRNSETDRIDFPTFIENEQREMNSSDPNKQNISTCIGMADHVFLNNTSIADLCTEAQKVLAGLGL